jgi:serine/threonine protein kinase
MPDFWRSLEGAVLKDRFRLVTCVWQSEDAACFAAESAQHGPVDAWLTTRDSHPDAAGIAHPNLLRVIESGQAQPAGAAVWYLVTERVEERLADVLRTRALTPEEARDFAAAVLDGLGALHAHGYAHGRIRPEHILAAGDTVKISAPVAAFQDAGDGTPYDPPEGGTSPAGDIWSLGVTIFESLTQRLPSDAGQLASLPEPFREMAGHALRPAAERWSAAQMSGFLRTGSAPIETSAAPAAPSSRAGIPAKWGYAAVAAAAALVLAIALKPGATVPSTVNSSAAPPKATTPVAATQPLPDAEKPSPYATADRPMTEAVAPPSPAVTPPAAPPPSSSERPYWRVIVYTFAQREAAEKKAEAINRQHPDFKAEVFSPQGGRPYLVALGGRMSREEASRLRSSAQESGLPRDSYIQNYSQ